jgi:hypothetical protein
MMKKLKIIFGSQIYQDFFEKQVLCAIFFISGYRMDNRELKSEVGCRRSEV